MASPVDGPTRNIQRKEGGGADEEIKRGREKKEGRGGEKKRAPAHPAILSARGIAPPPPVGGGGQGFRVMASLCARMGKRARRRRPPGSELNGGGAATSLDPRGVGIGAKDEPFASWAEGRPLGRNGRVIELGVGELGAWQKKAPFATQRGPGLVPPTGIEPVFHA